MQFTWEMCSGDEIKIQVFETVKYPNDASSYSNTIVISVLMQGKNISIWAEGMV
jgi:hypothetical protein